MIYSKRNYDNQPFLDSSPPFFNVLSRDGHLQIFDGLISFVNIWDSQKHGERVVVVKTEDFRSEFSIIINFEGFILVHHLYWNGGLSIHMKCILAGPSWVKWHVPFSLGRKTRII